MRAAQLGSDDWVRTTDLARLDADGFLWIVGRADQTILRGGYKVQPEVVRAALERDPGGGRGRGGRRARRRASVRCRSPRSSAAPAHDLDEGSLLAARERAPRARTRCRSRSSWSTRCRAPRRAKADLAAVRALFAERRGDREVVTVERWVFGEAAAARRRSFADAVRELTSTVLALEHSREELERITAELRTAQARLAAQPPGDLAPRVGDDVRPEQRVYVDHSRDDRELQPGFPVYELTCADDRAEGTVEFPLLYEGPPGLVHGGFLAVFFDCVLQQLNCDLGLAGKTAELALRFRRPTPLLHPVARDREPRDRRRAHPHARRALARGDVALLRRHERGRREPRRTSRGVTAARARPAPEDSHDRYQR